ncbi:MerR family transcriptional regulator [Ilumatobacter sp.]|uniref:MerR family transcriptional regulator n=1 Tax=Ilumatobacter sp. TaxID=1967498 RepID=UPI003C6907C4
MPDDDTADPSATYTLAELAVASGVSERTVRYYQSERLLPRPGKKGREAVYTDEHLDRLTVVGELRDRGLTLQTIRELVASDSPTTTVSEWLGVDATLTAPWSDDRPGTLTHDQLAEQIRRFGGDRPGVIGELQAAGYLHQQPDGTWLAPSPTLLQHALRLRQAGIDVDITARVRDLLRRRLSTAVDDTVELLVERTGTGFAGGASADELETAIGALRPVAREMSSIILAQEVERALADLLRSGPTKLAGSRRR